MDAITDPATFKLSRRSFLLSPSFFSVHLYLLPQPVLVKYFLHGLRKEDHRLGEQKQMITFGRVRVLVTSTYPSIPSRSEFFALCLLQVEVQNWMLLAGG